MIRSMSPSGASVVVTVLGPMSAEELGVTDSHDHLSLRSPALAGQEFDDPDKAVEEVLDAKQTGLQSIVELTPIGLGPAPGAVAPRCEGDGRQRDWCHWLPS